MLSFPIPPIFPQPTWIEPATLPAPAVLESTFLNGGRSALQISDTTYGLELKCEWKILRYSDLQRFWPFWKEVNISESFELPEGFWSTGMPPERQALYRRMNESGLWRFKGVPVLDDSNFDMPMLDAVLLGVLN